MTSEMRKPNAFTAMAILVGLVSGSPMALAQDGSPGEKKTSIVRATGAPEIDGVLDDAVWSEAVPIDDLHQVRPEEYAEPSQRTEFRLLYDSEALYVGIRAYESDPDLITANALRHYSTLRSEDRLKIILDPFNDKRSGYEFQVNPNSVLGDGIFKGERVDREWDGIWQAVSHIDALGWTAEMKIPFKTLSFNADSDWGLNLARDIARQDEQIAWSSRNRSTDPAVSGTMAGLSGISQGFGFDIVPSVSVTNSRAYSPRDESTGTEPSLELYYKLTTGMNASLTANTDFSVTEVDDRQVNLTRFSLFFPEKRSFFLRESDIFDFGGIGGNDNSVTAPRVGRENGRPYFSRRIGLSADGQAVDLDIGGKISGRIGRWNVGAMAIRQAEYEAVDASNIFVARASANILKESSAGFIVTDGDPRTNLDNSLLGFDFHYQNSRLANGRKIEADAWYQQSDTQGLSGDDAAFGITIKMPNRVGWRGSIDAREIQKNFNPAVGFVGRTDVRQYSTELNYTYQRNGDLIRSIVAGIDTRRSEFIDGDLQSQNLLFRLLELQSSSDDELIFRHEREKENLLEPFEISAGITIPVGNYSFASNEVSLETAEQRVVNLEATYREGDFFDGEIRSASILFGWRPSKHFLLTTSFSTDKVSLPQGKFATKLASTEIDVVFSNTISWVNLIQYDNITESIGLNSRIHWAPQAGRNLYFVVNHNYRERMTDRSYHSTNTDIVLKVDYTFRF